MLKHMRDAYVFIMCRSGETQTNKFQNVTVKGQRFEQIVAHDPINVIIYYHNNVYITRFFTNCFHAVHASDWIDFIV